MRLIDQDNNQIGIVDTDEAMRRAREAQLDLVEVAPKERPAVCRIMDYGRWKYSQKKRHKKHHHEQQLKEVRIRPKTDDNDRKIKVNRAIRFLKKGDKVQFTMVFRGRERAHREIGVEILMEIAKGMGDMIKLERPPSMDGRHMVMIVAPNKHVFDKIEKLEKLKKLGESETEETPAKKPEPASDAQPESSTETAPESQAAPPAEKPGDSTA